MRESFLVLSSPLSQIVWQTDHDLNVVSLDLKVNLSKNVINKRFVETFLKKVFVFMVNFNFYQSELLTKSFGFLLLLFSNFIYFFKKSFPDATFAVRIVERYLAKSILLMIDILETPNYYVE